jgi:hypothetical protein
MLSVAYSGIGFPYTEVSIQNVARSTVTFGFTDHSSPVIPLKMHWPPGVAGKSCSKIHGSMRSALVPTAQDAAGGGGGGLPNSGNCATNESAMALGALPQDVPFLQLY